MRGEYSKYLTVSDHDRSWGLYVNTCGYQAAAPGADYPRMQLDVCPWTWKNGRILNEFSLNFVSGGLGEFESEATGTRRVYAGTVILLFPRVWHRYRPGACTGWHEHWISFNGPMYRALVEKGLFSPHRPLIQMGWAAGKILDLFEQAIATARNEPAGCQQLMLGLIMQILAMVHVAPRSIEEESLTETLFTRAKDTLRDNSNRSVHMPAVADELGVGYSWFRRMFKNFAGLSPGQYHQQLRMHEAIRFLLHTDLPVKSIAKKLDFSSQYYFSRAFRRLTGISPMEYRTCHRVPRHKK